MGPGGTTQWHGHPLFETGHGRKGHKRAPEIGMCVPQRTRLGQVLVVLKRRNAKYRENGVKKGVGNVRHGRLGHKGRVRRALEK